MYYYLVLRVTNGKGRDDDIVACCPDSNAAEKIISECLEKDPQCFCPDGKTDAEVMENQDKDFIYIYKYKANAINPDHYYDKCYVLRFFSDDSLEYRIVAVCTSQTKAEQLKEQYIKFRGGDNKMRCDMFREELEIIEHNLSFRKNT